MTDHELNKLCAAAMQLQIGGKYGDAVITVDGLATTIYDPLHDDAQAMALVKRFDLEILSRVGEPDGKWTVTAFHYMTHGHDANLNRAIVACVAKMTALKESK